MYLIKWSVLLFDSDACKYQPDNLFPVGHGNPSRPREFLTSLRGDVISERLLVGDTKAVDKLTELTELQQSSRLLMSIL